MNEPWIPKGFHTVTPNIVVDNAEDAIDLRRGVCGMA